jgi:hypothetical protein
MPVIPTKREAEVGGLRSEAGKLRPNLENKLMQKGLGWGRGNGSSGRAPA